MIIGISISSITPTVESAARTLGVSFRKHRLMVSSAHFFKYLKIKLASNGPSSMTDTKEENNIEYIKPLRPVSSIFGS